MCVYIYIYIYIYIYSSSQDQISIESVYAWKKEQFQTKGIKLSGKLMANMICLSVFSRYFCLRVILKGEEKEDEKKESLKLSLKYQFVTPLTSMVVTKPQEGDVEVAHKPKEEEREEMVQMAYGSKYDDFDSGMLKYVSFLMNRNSFYLID